MQAPSRRQGKPLQVCLVVINVKPLDLPQRHKPKKSKLVGGSVLLFSFIDYSSVCFTTNTGDSALFS
jgi:hypothetical protein